MFLPVGSAVPPSVLCVGPTQTPSPPASNPNEKTFQKAFFSLDVVKARDLGPYDITVIGTSIGGGIIAADLFDTMSMLGKNAKMSLLLRKTIFDSILTPLMLSVPAILAKIVVNRMTRFC